MNLVIEEITVKYSGATKGKMLGGYNLILHETFHPRHHIDPFKNKKLYKKKKKTNIFIYSNSIVHNNKMLSVPIIL